VFNFEKQQDKKKLPKYPPTQVKNTFFKNLNEILESKLIKQYYKCNSVILQNLYNKVSEINNCRVIFNSLISSGKLNLSIGIGTQHPSIFKYLIAFFL